MEYARPRARRARLYDRQPLAQPRGVFRGPRGDRGVPGTKVEPRARLPPDQRSLGLSRQPHRRALCVRVARRSSVAERARTLACWWSMIFSENRYPLFGITL